MGLAAVVLPVALWVCDPFAFSSFPFIGSGGFDLEASVFTVTPSGRLAESRVCVVWMKEQPDPAVRFFVRAHPHDDAFDTRAREQPYLFYEFDWGSGVGSWCAVPLEDDEFAQRVAARMGEACPDLVPSSTAHAPARLFGLTPGDGTTSPCQRPPNLTYEIE